MRLQESHQGNLLRSSLILRVTDSKLLREQTRLDSIAEDHVSRGDSRGVLLWQLLLDKGWSELAMHLGVNFFFIRPPVPCRDERGEIF